MTIIVIVYVEIGSSVTGDVTPHTQNSNFITKNIGAKLCAEETKDS